MGYLRIYPPKGKTLSDLSPELQALAEEQNALADEFERALDNSARKPGQIASDFSEDR